MQVEHCSARCFRVLQRMVNGLLPETQISSWEKLKLRLKENRRGIQVVVAHWAIGAVSLGGRAYAVAMCLDGVWASLG